LRKNKIQVLHYGGLLVYTHGAKERVLSDFYAGLMGSSVDTYFDFDIRAMYSPLPLLSTLDALFSEDEAYRALSRMRSDAAPGPDGFSPGFFKCFWPVVKGDLLCSFDAFCSGHSGLQPLNQAFIALLPKYDDVATTHGFRPISLQSTVLNLLSKTIANRVQPLMHEHVSLDQSGFIKGRNIRQLFLCY
jgi:hypothetical protein